jgi:UDP-N-acetylmuramate--alanine ligase
MNLEHIKYVYFVGIGGIGMSAIARWFHRNSRLVMGYDRVRTDLTQALEDEGIGVHYQDDIDLIPKEFRSQPEQTLVVYTPAIPESHRELNYFARNGFTIKKRAEVLGIITNPLQTIAVAGTHGKTTTSSMLTHLLKYMGFDMAAFLGGIATNFGSNLVLNEELTPQTVAVVEADEFDRSFLHLRPKWAIITSTDADHLDIYQDEEQFVAGFEAFAAQVQAKIWASSGVEARLKKQKNVALYGRNDSTLPYQATHVRIENGLFVFDFFAPEEQILITDIALPILGFHNIDNMTAAIACLLEVRKSVYKQSGRSVFLTAQEQQSIREGVAAYRGVRRRFEVLVATDSFVLVDDYAHHPTEIQAFLESLRALYPQWHIVAIFQPHLYSRTRDFLEGFAESLALADEIGLLPIYPAREEPIEGIESHRIYELIEKPLKHLLDEEQVLAWIENIRTQHPQTIVATIGAGDISLVAADLEKALR